MLDLLELLTFVWLAFWALRAFVWIAGNRRHPILIVILVHFLFCGTPLLLDKLFGQPLYIYTPGFFLATRDETSAVIYCLYVSAAPLIWWWLGKGRLRAGDNETPDEATGFVAELLTGLRPFFVLLIVSPLLAWILAPEPWLYLQYGVASFDELNSEPRSISALFSDPARYKDVIFSASFLCVVGTAALLTSYRRLHVVHLYALLPWWLLAIWLNGKRYIVAMLLFVVGYILWERGHLQGKRLVAAAAGMLLIMTIYSAAYQIIYRGQNLEDSDRWYENVRMDYGRDDRIKLAIYAELRPNVVRILEYRGQSLVFYFAYPVPRIFWPEKPFPYAVYATSAIAMFDSPRQIGWGLTTSILDEAIANFSWAGMVLGPLWVALICRVGEACRNSMITSLTALIACLFLAVHLNAFMVLFWIWIAVAAGWQWQKRRTPATGRSTAPLQQSQAQRQSNVRS